MKLSLAIGTNKKDTKWKNTLIVWEDLVRKISVTKRTMETLKEYTLMKKEKQDQIKDVGGFVSGHLLNQRRNVSSVSSKQILTFDADTAVNTEEFWATLKINYGCAAAIYSTHKHTPDNPRLRLLIPLTREVFPDEYSAIIRRIAFDLGIDQFDPTGFQVNRLMFWPSTPIDGEFIFKEQKGEFLDPDAVLNTYVNWQDIAEWPLCSSEKKLSKTTSSKQGEPIEKPGLIGAFNRTYPIDSCIDNFLSDVYIPCGERYTYLKGSTSGGAIVYDNKFLFSHHSTDPASMILCNSFDLVRIHKFLDKDSDDDSIPINKRPSYLAMLDLASNNKRIKHEYGEQKIKEAFEGKEEFDWLAEVDMDRKGNYLNTLNNILLILENDPNLTGKINFDAFAQRGVFTDDVPWRTIKKQNLITDPDLVDLENYIEKVYKISTGSNKISGCLKSILDKHEFHPIVDYLRRLRWDGTERVETLFIDYLGAQDSTYTRTVTRKSLVACVARVMMPGIKFDNIITLIGDEGQGKSQIINRLGGKWFSDSFNLHMLKGKEAYEQIQGVWLVEIGELSGMANADVEKVKSFVAASKDRYRSPYARIIEGDRLRQCVFFATTNEREPLKSKTGNRRFWPITTYFDEPAFSVFDMNQETIDQVWAEAFELYKNKEPLFLDKEMTQIAKNIQEIFTEENPLIETIENFLNKKIPANWYMMPKWDKIDFISNYESQDHTNLEQRTKVCSYEIWEIAMNKKDTLDIYGLKLIKQAMNKIDYYERINTAVRFGNSYPQHKGSYVRIL